MKKKYYFILLLIFAVLLGKYFLPEDRQPIHTEGKLAVSFIDVDQGDSTFIEFPGGKTMLIDAGEASEAEEVLSYIKERGHKTVDYVVCTHPHSDHIGGMKKVIESLDIGAVYMPKVSHTSKTFENLLLSIREKGLTIQSAKAGVSLEPEADVTITFLAPVGEQYQELNDYSAVMHLAYGETSFLFTGDAETVSEKDILINSGNLDADVLKVGHHGSSTSSHQNFLDAVSPRYAVISCGEGNSYGHPHDEVLNRLENMQTKLYRTDQNGTVMAVSDGQNLSFVTEEE